MPENTSGFGEKLPLNCNPGHEALGASITGLVVGGVPGSVTAMVDVSPTCVEITDGLTVI